jgi:hypothetical protein
MSRLNSRIISKKELRVEIQKIEYKGWNESIEITNDAVRVVVVPQIGRIMHYGFRDEENLIWINPAFEGKSLSDVSPDPEAPNIVWANFGGDKVWPTEQFRWPEVNGRDWPPDPWFDGSPHLVEMLPEGVRLTSPVSHFCGARLIREIRLTESGSRVMIHQIIEKVHSARNPDVEPLPMTIWSVTQVKKPEEIWIPLDPVSRLTDQVHFFDDKREARSNLKRECGIGIFKPSDTVHQKIGSDGDRWVVAVFGKTVFGQLFRRKAGALHPDGNLSVEVYTSPERYAELEVLSSLQSLKLGQTLQWNMEWMLLKSFSGLNSSVRREKTVRSMVMH